MFRFLAGLGFYLGLMASAAAAPEISAREAPPEHIWLADSEGVSVHMVTGLRCPESVGNYTLDELANTDRMGFNVSCFYENKAGETVSLGILRLQGDASFDDTFLHMKSGLVRAQKGLAEIEMKETPILPRSTHWRSQGHRQSDGKRGGMWMADYYGWALYLSAMHAPKNAKRAMDAVTQLMASADASARKHLEICARSLPPARRGQLLADEPIELATQALTLLAYGEHMRSGQNIPAHWCAMGYMQEGDLPLTIWRNVGPEAPLRPAYRITFEADKGPAIFHVVRDSYAADYFNAEHGYKSAPRDAHVLVGYVDDAVAFGAFDYEPSPTLFGRRVIEVLKQEYEPSIRLDARGDIWVQGQRIPPEAFGRGR